MGQQEGNWDVGLTNYWEGSLSALEKSRRGEFVMGNYATALL